MSQGTLIGIDQLVIGATAACDLTDLNGTVAISTGTAITPQLLRQLKDAGIIGLIAGRADFACHHVTAKRPTLECIAARITEMRRRSGITDSLTPQIRSFAEKTLTESFKALYENKLPEIATLKILVDKILHDIELAETSPLPSPGLKPEDYLERLIDKSIDMAVLTGWHLRHAGADEETVRGSVLGALLHDSGFLFVSQSTLDNKGVFSKTDTREIRRHPYLGLRALSPLNAEMPQFARDLILQHHEREDGKGYPLGKSGDSIPKPARLAHILDSYIALVSPRPHRKAYEPYRAIEILMRESGKSFNRSELREFIDRTGRYPRGSAVLLSNNEVGVVISPGNGGPFRPVIDVYFSQHHQFSATPRRVDLSHDKLKYIRQVMR